MTGYMFLHELTHFSFSLFVGVLLYLRYKDLKLILISLFMGFLIDIDHFFDYFYYVVSNFTWTGLHFNISEFFNPALYVHGSQKVFVILHGWEFLLPLFYLGKSLKNKYPGIIIAILIPYIIHMAIDQFSGVRTPFSYIFIYRLINNFSMSAFNGF